MKKIILMILSITLLGTSLAYSQSLTLSTSSATSSAGDGNFSVFVNLNSDVNLATLGFKVNIGDWAGSGLTIQEYKKAGRTATDPNSGGIDNTNGIVTLSIGSLSGSSAIDAGSGAIVEIVLSSNGSAPADVHNLSISNINNWYTTSFQNVTGSVNTGSMGSITINRDDPDIDVDPTSKNYGNILVGGTASQTFVVTNEGTANLDISSVTLTGGDAGQFNIESGGGSFILAPSGTRNVVVSFNPTSIGGKSTTLRIASNDPDEDPFDVALSGTGVEPDINVDPTSKDYGNVLVGSSDSQIFTVSNTGTADLNVTSVTLTGTGAGQFNVESGGGAFTLTPGQSRNVEVSFNPSSLGSKSANLRFASDDPNENPYDAALSGTGVAPDIAVDPTSKDYGNIQVGSSSAQSYTVSNTGTAVLNVTGISLTGGNSGEFSITDNSPFSLNPGETQNVEVSFNPTSTGNKTTTLRLTSNDPDENLLDVPLSGNGTNPDIHSDLTSHNYGSVQVNSNALQTFVISNQGNMDLNVTNVALGGANPGEFSITDNSSFTLGAGETRNVEVRFNPTSEGAKTATLALTSNDPDENPYNITLEGTGVVTPDIDSDLSSHDYGNVLIGDNASQTFVITNAGTGTLNVTNSSITGTHADQFSIQSGTAPFDLTGSAKQNVIIRFSPASTGSKSAILRLTSNDPDENPFDIALTGSGTEPDIAINPTVKSYGFVPVGSSSSQTFVVTNEGSATLNVTNVSLSGTHADQFSIDAGGGAFSLSPAATRNVNVSFNPTSPNEKYATLVITSNDPDESPLNVALSGNDVRPIISATPNPKDYGTLEVGQTASQRFVVSNQGSVDLTVSGVSLTGTHQAEFSIDAGGGSFTLAPSATRNVDVSFNPATAGAKTASLRFTSNDPNNNPYDVVLTANGVVIPDIAANPTSKNFGNIVSGSSASQTFVISNTGTGTLSVSNVALTGANAGQFSIDDGGGTFTVAAGGTHNIDVSFNSALPLGTKTATLQISSDDPDENPLNVDLTGNTVVPDIATDLASKDYGTIEKNKSASQTFVISNQGTATLNVTNIAITGTNQSEFSIDAGGAPFNLAPGGIQNVNVSFNPTSEGSKSATLQLTSNDPDENPLNIALSGECVLITDIAVTPASKNFGSVQVGQTSSQTFVVSNEGTGDLNVTSVALTGTNAGEFSIDAGGGAFTLIPGATRNVEVTFSPTVEGSKVASLNFTSNDPDENPFSVPLTGNTAIRVTINTNPAGMEFSVDGTSYITEQIFLWSEGEQHTVDVTSPVAVAAGTQRRFNNWSDGGAKGHVFTTPTGETVLTATFDLQYYLKVISSHGTPTGEGWYNAGSDAQFSVDNIIEIDGNRYVFNQWNGTGSGSYTGTNTTQTVTMNNPITENASWWTFYRLQVLKNPENGGEVTLSPDWGWYGHGKVVSVSAVENARFNWIGWSGDLNSTERSTEIMMDAPKSIVANFEGENLVPVTIKTQPEGRQFKADNVTYTSMQTFQWDAGSEHGLDVVSPQAGSTGVQYVYNTWSDGGDQAHTYTTSTFAETLIVNFTTQYLLTISENPDEGGDVTLNPPGDWYDAGTDVELTASAHETEGWHWNGWSDDLTGSNNPAQVTMSSPKNISADFIKNKYMLTVTVDPQNSGQVLVDPDSTSYTHGSIVTLKAFAANGFMFDNWSGDASGSADSIVIEMNSNKNIQAHFYQNDVSAPVLKNVAPAPGACSVPKNTAIIFRIEDQSGGTGVDSASIHVTVESQIKGETIDVITNGSLVSSGVAMTSHSPEYTITYQPEVPFLEEDTITVRVIANDLVRPANRLQTEYAFTIGISKEFLIVEEPVTTAGDTVGAGNGQVQVVIPPGAIPDSAGSVTIGVDSVDTSPAIPDSAMHGFGIQYHFRPDGFQFSQMITIRIPYTNADLDSAGIESPDSLTVYYFSSLVDEWVQVDVDSSDSQYIYIKVDKFCYFTLVKTNTPTTGIDERCLSLEIPKEFGLKQNYPNPFNPETVIRYDLAENCDVNITIYNITGQHVRTLVQSHKRAGTYEVIWNGLNEYDQRVGSGIYFYVLQAGSFKKVMKATLLK